MIEIDISMAGGLLEARKIADLAAVYNMPVATHNVMGPVATIASANCCATMQDFLGHESFDFKDGRRAGEGDLIVYDREIIQDGHIQLSDKPGLGLDLNKEFVVKHLMEGETWWGLSPPFEPPEDICQCLRLDLFGAQSRLGQFPRGGTVASGQVVAQRLALLPEAQAGEFEEPAGVEAEFAGAVARIEYDYGGIHCGRRIEGRRRNRERHPRIGPEPPPHGQIPVVSRSRPGGQAFGHFLLHQKNRARRSRAHFERALDNRCGGIVGQVPGNHRRRPAGEIRLEGVRGDEIEPRLAPQPALEDADHPGIDLERHHAVRAREQPFSEKTLPGTDLEYQGFALRAGQTRDALEHRAPDQKMLSKPPASHADGTSL